jgi:hypothetical protein
LSAVLLNVLFAIWVVVTVLFIAIVVCKSFMSTREDEVLYLGPSDSSKAREQKLAKVERMVAWAKVLGITSAVLLLITGGLWLYLGLSNMIRT